MKRTWTGLFRFGGVGDNLIASSVFPGLKKKFDGLEVISRAPNATVFENNPFIDKLTVWPENASPESDQGFQRNIERHRREYDAFFHLSHTCEAELVLMEGQTMFWASEKMRRARCDYSYLSFVHDFCDVPHDFAPGFYPTEKEELQAWDTLNQIRSLKPGPVVGWCLSGSRVDKQYPFVHFAIARIIAELGCSVIMFGAPRDVDFQMSDFIIDNVKKINSTDAGLHRAISPNTRLITPQSFAALSPSAQEVVFAGKELWGTRRILSLIQLCDVFVSPDTGPAWAIAVSDVPKVMLLSHASPMNITHGWRNTITLHADPKRVDCWPCHRLHDSFETCRTAEGIDGAAACMADIGTQQVVDAVRKSLESRAT